MEKIHGVHKSVKIALVGKYTGLHDAYLSVAESLFHAGTACDAQVHIEWVDSETLTAENVGEVLGGCGGVLVPGGFGDRGIEGMILAAQYAREHDVPYLGICLGMQIAVIEFARHVVGWSDAHSAEFSDSTEHPVIALMSDQVGITAKGGTMRLGKYPCVLAEDSLARAAYGTPEISERHRHRYEFNNEFRPPVGGRGPASGRPVPGWPARGDCGGAEAEVVRRRPVPPGVQEPPQPPAPRVRGLRARGNREIIKNPTAVRWDFFIIRKKRMRSFSRPAGRELCETGECCASRVSGHSGSCAEGCACGIIEGKRTCFRKECDLR